MKPKTINPHLCGEKAHKQNCTLIAMQGKYLYPYKYSKHQISKLKNFIMLLVRRESAKEF